MREREMLAPAPLETEQKKQHPKEADKRSQRKKKNDAKKVGKVIAKLIWMSLSIIYGMKAKGIM